MRAISRRHIRHSNRRGVSIIESVIAMGVLGLTIGGACRLTLASNQASDIARMHYQAANIARNRLERGRALGFSQLAECAESRVRVDCFGAPDKRGRFRRSTEVNAISDSLREVIVTVEIQDRVKVAFIGESEIVQSTIADFDTEAQ